MHHSIKHFKGVVSGREQDECELQTMIGSVPDTHEGGLDIVYKSVFPNVSKSDYRNHKQHYHQSCYLEFEKSHRVDHISFFGILSILFRL